MRGERCREAWEVCDTKGLEKRWLQRGDSRGSMTRPCVEAKKHIEQEGGDKDGLAGYGFGGMNSVPFLKQIHVLHECNVS
jgi:hypothetical protein